MTMPDNIQRSAIFSPDQKQRLALLRSWTMPTLTGGWQPSALWVMHNPSDADGEKDDPTARRVIEFTAYWGFSRACVVNLIPFISSKPAEAHAWADQNDLAMNNYVAGIRALVRLESQHFQVIVAAWGAIAREEDVACFLSVYRATGRKLSCIGQTKTGAPIHPLARGRNRPPLAAPQPYWSPL